ncbi:MAG: hypothetical protein LUF00_02395 [Lachnospiraceae bacterium]|nr:hypothetical protein [Lachnospiraceae bacterium]
MKKLAFVIPAQLDEAGQLIIKNRQSLQEMVSYLKSSYEITLLIRGLREKKNPELSKLGVRVLYDNSILRYDTDGSLYPSRFQSSYYMWKSRSVPDREGESRQIYDILIAWDGCSPWCLATALNQFGAKKRLLWVHEDPGRYLMEVDRRFYTDLCAGFDTLIASDDKIKTTLDGLFRDRIQSGNCIVVRPLVYAAWYWEQSEQPIDCEFPSDTINLLAVSKMCRESSFERLPRWLSEHTDSYPPLHCYLLGMGERFDRYIQQIALYSMDAQMTLLGQIDNPYPYVRRCDVLLLCEEERQSDVETAARVFGIPVIRFDDFECCLTKLKKREAIDQPSITGWQDEHVLRAVLEER